MQSRFESKTKAFSSACPFRGFVIQVLSWLWWNTGHYVRPFGKSTVPDIPKLNYNAMWLIVPTVITAIFIIYWAERVGAEVPHYYKLKQGSFMHLIVIPLAVIVECCAALNPMTHILCALVWYRALVILQDVWRALFGGGVSEVFSFSLMLEFIIHINSLLGWIGVSSVCLCPTTGGLCVYFCYAVQHALACCRHQTAGCVPCVSVAPYSRVPRRAVTALCSAVGPTRGQMSN